MFGLTLVNKKDVEGLEKTREYFQEILDVLPDIIEGKGGTYEYNEPGSGDITYELRGNSLEFNQFTSEFTGFYVNSKKVSFKEFINFL